AFYGRHLRLGFGSYLGVEGYYSWLKTKANDPLFTLPGGTPGTGREMELRGYGGDLTLNLLPSIAFDPYVLGGWHEEKITSKTDVPSKIQDWENGLEFGGGIKLGLGSKIALRGEIRDKLWKLPPSSSSINNLSYTGGLQLTLGGSAHGGDADKDGVPDKNDRCPNTPKGALVDASGCPIDSDGDGVPDDKDLCPNTLPNVKVDADGCPIELNEKETELLDKGRITTREIHFETAKWDILPESRPVLDDIGKILIQWPKLKIEIGG